MPRRPPSLAERLRSVLDVDGRSPHRHRPALPAADPGTEFAERLRAAVAHKR